MSARPRIILKLIDQRGNHNCHHGHKIGDVFDFDADRGKLCPMALHTAFPYADILRYGGSVPDSKDYGKIVFCCPDADVINVFEIDVVSIQETRQE